MTISAIQSAGNSSKFRVVTKRGEFIIAMSFTLRTKAWALADAAAELSAANELAEAIVSRHDPLIPFKPLYIFAEHNSEPTLEKAIRQIRRYGLDG